MKTNKENYEFLRRELLEADKNLLALKNGQTSELKSCLNVLRMNIGQYNVTDRKKIDSIWEEFEFNYEKETNENRKLEIFTTARSQAFSILSRFLRDLEC